MAEQGHGNHWECITNIDDLVKNQLLNLVQNGKLEDKEEVNAIFFDDGVQSTEPLFSIAAEGNFSALALIVTSRDKTSNQFVSGFPFVRDGAKLELTITEIKEWDNKYEAVLVAETADDHTISFFDTKYYKNKDKYKIGGTYTFAVAALGYNVEFLKEKSFSFEGQKAVDWLAKIGKKPTYDSNGNVEPIVFDLSNLVTYLPRTEYPDDAEFQSPINAVETIKAFDNDFYKINITIFRDPDVCIDLYAKTSFFDYKPDVNEPLRGVIWVQGYLSENTTKQQSELLNSDGEPIIN
ncbi:MAG: hypothetical protein LBQ28_06670 [Prevotellaceae bacterium]|jgi:hypothetical protein|nr:hypothetical protein [Prevotellaceae bacterium]